MGYKCSFLDNEIYGADDVSEAFSKIISNGVRVECSNEKVISSLNSLTSETVESGTRSYSDLNVTYTDGIFTINSGTGFFASGVSVTVDADGIRLERRELEKGYISIVYDEDFNKVLPQITVEKPTGDVLLLAEFDGEKLTDIRQYASTKLAVNSANCYHDFTIEIKRFSNFGQLYSDSTATYEMPHNAYKYLLLRTAECEELPLYLNDTVIDLTVEGTQKFKLNRNSIKTELWVEREGNILKFSAFYAYMPYQQTYEFTLA